MPWEQATNVITGVVSSEFLKPGSGEYLTSQLIPAVATAATNVVTGTAPLAAWLRLSKQHRWSCQCSPADSSKLQETCVC